MRSQQQARLWLSHTQTKNGSAIRKLSQFSLWLRENFIRNLFPHLFDILTLHFSVINVLTTICRIFYLLSFHFLSLSPLCPHSHGISHSTFNVSIFLLDTKSNTTNKGCDWKWQPFCTCGTIFFSSHIHGFVFGAQDTNKMKRWWFRVSRSRYVFFASSLKIPCAMWVSERERV